MADAALIRNKRCSCLCRVYSAQQYRVGSAHLCSDVICAVWSVSHVEPLSSLLTLASVFAIAAGRGKAPCPCHDLPHSLTATIQTREHFTTKHLIVSSVPHEDPYKVLYPPHRWQQDWCIFYSWLPRLYREPCATILCVLVSCQCSVVNILNIYIGCARGCLKSEYAEAQSSGSLILHCIR